MARVRRKFSGEFKQEAVRLVTMRGASLAQAARDLGIHGNLLRGWVHVHAADPDHAFSGGRQQKPDQAELTQLRREVARLKMERDILKKPRPTSPGSRCDVRRRGDAPSDVARRSAVRGARALAKWILCVDVPTDECTRAAMLS